MQPFVMSACSTAEVSKVGGNTFRLFVNISTQAIDQPIPCLGIE